MRTARPERLKRRADFLAVAKGARVNRTAFTLQARRHAGDAPARPPRLGFTVTKKVGTAVVRNRIRRRFRALTDHLAGEFAPETDYVIVARVEALDAPSGRLGDELAAALRAVRRKLDKPVPRP